jgi:hypothetical protein
VRNVVWKVEEDGREEKLGEESTQRRAREEREEAAR